MSVSVEERAATHDPSVGEDAATAPFEWGGKVSSFHPEDASRVGVAGGMAFASIPQRLFAFRGP